MRLVSTISEERRLQSFCQNQTLLCLSQKEIMKFHLLYEPFLQKAGALFCTQVVQMCL